MSTERTNEIEETASDWLVRRDSEHWTAADQALLERWLDASTLHRVAFLRLELAWEETARLKALGAGADGDRPPPPGRWNLTPFFAPDGSVTVASPKALRPRWWFPAVAATVLLAIGTGAYIGFGSFRNHYVTPVGGIASVPMTDGSKVTLNTDTAIRLAVTDTERRVDLQQGEAFFEVAKDPTRPFIVRAGSKRVIAVGTKFSVRRDARDIEVVVTEGKVRIEDTSAQVLLTPGTIARAGDAGVLVQRKSLVDAESQLSWRVGMLMFRDQRLADAIAEFNRYNVRKVLIADPAVADLKIEGNFRANNVEAFVRLLESGFPIRASADDDRIVLTSR